MYTCLQAKRPCVLSNMALITASWPIDAVLLLISTYVLLYKFFTRHFNYWKNRNVPFIKPQAFFGNMKEMVQMKIIGGQHFASLYNKMKGHPYFGIFVFDSPVLILRDPNLIKTILVKDFGKFADRTILVDEKKQPLTANALFISKNPGWRHMRTQLTVAFTSGKLKAMVPLMNDVADELGVFLKKHATNVKCLETKELSSKYTTDVIASCAFGINANSFTHENAEFLRMGKKLTEFSVEHAITQPCIFFAPAVAKFFNMKFIPQDVLDFLENSFVKTIAERQKSQYRRNDLIDIILDMKNKSNENFTFGKYLLTIGNLMLKS